MDEEMRDEYEELYRLSTKEKRMRAYMRVASKRLDELELESKKDAINIMGNLIVSNLLFMDMVSALTGDINGKESIRVASDFMSRGNIAFIPARSGSKRVKNKHGRIFIAENINTYHIGSSSHDLKYDYYSKLNRNWHYNWSRHYYNKKHQGLFFAYRKSISLLLKLFMKLILNLICFNFSKSKLIIVEISGLISAMTGLSSFYRPYKKII